jgi:hypothetical protein
MLLCRMLSVNTLALLGVDGSERSLRPLEISFGVTCCALAYIYMLFTALSLLRSQIYTIQTTFIYDFWTMQVSE